MLFLENCWESCWAPDWSCWHGMASCILCWGKKVFRAWWLEASSLCVYLLLLAPWVAFYPAGNTAWLLALGSSFLFPCLSCWPACWRKERQIPIFTDFLEMFKDGFARDLCIFFLSKSWPGWMLSEVWFPFPLPELFFCACCVLVHIFFSLLQLPVQVAAISCGGFDMFLNRSHALSWGCVQWGLFSFEMNGGFLIKCLYS